MATVSRSPLVFDSIDDSSADLIVELQIADLEELELTQRGKQRADTMNDAEIAARLFKDNLEDLRVSLADRRMTKSLAQAVQADRGILTRSILEEEVARVDHALAQRLNGGDDDAEVDLCLKTIEDHTVSKLARLHVSEEFDDNMTDDHVVLDLSGGMKEEPEASERAAFRKSDFDSSVNHRCDACRESKRYFDVFAAPCRHEYCRDCLHDLFKAALTDESLFPPRCCRQNIPLDTMRIFLTSDMVLNFRQKEIEFGTANRTYCSRPEWSSFIAEENIHDEVASCPSCRARTCAICKAGSHDGEDCPRDTAFQATMDLARESGWQRCYACRRLVELDIGCNHITFVVTMGFF